MRMLFQQRLFSWFDSYDIYDEAGNVLFVVKGQPAASDRSEGYVGTMAE